VEKLTFKEYLESKERLLKQLKESPIRTATYNVKRYCRIPVGELKEAKEYIPLKPKQRVVVEWKYEDINSTPDPMSITFKDVNSVNPERKYQTFWTGDRLQKWVDKNAREV